MVYVTARLALIRAIFSYFTANCTCQRNFGVKEVTKARFWYMMMSSRNIRDSSYTEGIRREVSGLGCDLSTRGCWRENTVWRYGLSIRIVIVGWVVVADDPRMIFSDVSFNHQLFMSTRQVLLMEGGRGIQNKKKREK
jgi:hypothetical protein